MAQAPRSGDVLPAIAPPLDRAVLRRAVRRLCECDPRLASVVHRFGPPPLWSRRPGFATLLRIILEQQVSLASAAATYRRLQRQIGRVSAGRVARLSEVTLRQMGFTRQKAAYCVGVARSVASGALPLHRLPALPDADVRRLLCAVRGIGPWTADIYLLMALRRPDVWPEGDLALATAARRVLRLRAPSNADRIGRIATRWRPWRSVAARILWHAYLSERRMRRRPSGV